jgi:hypothetical protein
MITLYTSKQMKECQTKVGTDLCQARRGKSSVPAYPWTKKGNHKKYLWTHFPEKTEETTSEIRTHVKCVTAEKDVQNQYFYFPTTKCFPEQTRTATYSVKFEAGPILELLLT